MNIAGKRILQNEEWSETFSCLFLVFIWKEHCAQNTRSPCPMYGCSNVSAWLCTVSVCLYTGPLEILWTHLTLFVIQLIMLYFKGSLTRDFRLQVFFMNQCPPGPQVFHWGGFVFFSQKFAEIFANEYLSPVSPPINYSTVSMTPAIKESCLY